MESFKGHKFAKGLVLGFLVTEDNMETRYAVYNNGDIMQSEKREYSSNFVQGAREKWTKVNAVPDHAEFIGNYPSLHAHKKIMNAR